MRGASDAMRWSWVFAIMAALVNFARMDGVNRLLGRGIIRFDMRDPDKFVLRLPKTQDTVAAKSGGDDAAATDEASDGEG